MKLYINNLIPRLQQFSESLDKKEIFIEIPWVMVDANLNQQKYIFKRNGDLVMALNGQVNIGKWEYLSAARSLLIDRIQDKILLNQNFIDPVVMVLKKDGLKDENMILVNELLLPDLDVSKYLSKLYYRKNNISIRELKTGESLEINNFDGDIYNNKVTIEGELVPDGFVEIARSDKKFVIKGSRIVKVLTHVNYETNRGKITIEQTEYLDPCKGDFVFQNNKAAPDGQYSLGFMKYIRVWKGRIIRQSSIRFFC